MDFPPVFSGAYRDGEGNREGCGPLHRLLEDPRGLRRLAFRGLRDQLVVDLEDQPGAHSPPAVFPVDPYHRDLDDVRRASLDRGVDRHPLRRLPEDLVPRVDVPEKPAPPQDRSHEAVAARLLLDLPDVVAHAGITVEVLVDVLLRLPA